VLVYVCIYFGYAFKARIFDFGKSAQMGTAEMIAVALAATAVGVLVAAVWLMGRGYVRALRYYGKYQSARFPRARLSDLFTHLKTGDILLFVPFAHGFYNSMLTDDLFSHAAMIVSRDGSLYTSEATEGAELGSAGHARPGADLVPLLARLKNYSGTAYVMRLNKSLPQTVADKINGMAGETHPYPTLMQIVKGAGIVDASFQPGFLNSKAITEIADAGIKKPLLNGYSYLPPLQILYDLDAEKI
jgi:hypothetical protein